MTKLALALLVPIAILALSCSPLGPGQSAAGSAVQAAGDSALATVKINVPSVAPFVVMNKGGGGAKALGSRLFMGATKVQFDIYDNWYSGLRGSWTISKSISTDRLSPASTSDDILMPTGIFYVWIGVYNDNVSPDFLAAKNDFGQRITVSLADPNIYAFTVSPASVIRISPNGATQRYDPTEAYSLNQYAEAWFIFTARTETTKVVCTTSAGDADIYVFGSSDYAPAGSSIQPDLAEDSVTLTLGLGVQYDYIIGVWGFKAGTTYSLFIDEGQASGSVTIN